MNVVFKTHQITFCAESEEEIYNVLVGGSLNHKLLCEVPTATFPGLPSPSSSMCYCEYKPNGGGLGARLSYILRPL